MTDWRQPPETDEEDTKPLLAKMERLEEMVLRVVEDEVGDPEFKLLHLIASWMLVLETRINAAFRGNRRRARKREMLASEETRAEVCERLGGVEALERWEERGAR